MKLLRNFWDALKRVFKRQRGSPVRVGCSPHEAEVAGSNPALASNTEIRIPMRRHTRRYIPKPGRQATRQDISRFMKHGRQASWYRKSVKAKKRPEDENE